MLRRLVRWGPSLALVRVRGTVTDCTGADARVSHGSSESITVSQPPFRDGNPTAGEYELAAPYVCAYDDARLLGGEDPLAITRSGEPVLDVARGLEFDVLRQLRRAAHRVGWPTVVAELFPQYASVERDVPRYGTVVPFTRQTPEMGYYHWLTEYLPRVRGIEAYARETGECPDVLLEPGPPSWIVESLELAGVAPEDCVHWDVDRATVDRLVVPRYTRKAFPEPFEPSAADLEWVRDRLGRSVPDASGRSPDRLFVSRADADERRIENRGEVERRFEDHGFEIVVPSEHTVAEQVRLFRDATVIAGPHGAGLTNALFATDATLLELFPRDYTPAYFYVIAELFDLRHDFVLGGEATPDFTVPIDRLEAALDDLP